jgi:hypothetical protein
MSVQFIHLAGLFSNGYTSRDEFVMGKLKEGKITALETFWKRQELTKILDANPDIKIFLDSGAHSLLNAQVGLINKGNTVETEKKVENDKITFTSEEFEDRLTINQRISYAAKKGGAVQFFADWSFNKKPDVRKYLDEYIEFIHKYKNQLLGYVNLDIIYNAEESFENQQYMESNGLRPIPVFHYGEDFKWLEHYVNNYDYIGIGGVAGGITLQQFVQSLGNRAFEYISHTNPGIKVHGFAVTSISLMQHFPWYSTDSTTWLKHAVYGEVMVPNYDPAKEKFDYAHSPLVVPVSIISMVKSSKKPHYTLAFPKEVVERIEQYFVEAGVDPEKLKTDALERMKTNIYYYEQLLGCESIHQPSKYKSGKSFF